MKLTDTDFCESKCPVCTNARKGNKLAQWLQKLEMLVTGGGCPAGRARRRQYGVRPDEPIEAAKREEANCRAQTANTIK
jgi:hypothetical protein